MIKRNPDVIRIVRAYHCSIGQLNKAALFLRPQRLLNGLSPRDYLQVGRLKSPEVILRHCFITWRDK